MSFHRLEGKSALDARSSSLSCYLTPISVGLGIGRGVGPMVPSRMATENPFKLAGRDAGETAKQKAFLTNLIDSTWQVRRWFAIMDLKSAFETDGNATEDHFSRKSFARRLAQTIRDQPPGDCLVVSISSEWGSGKTSVLEWVKETWRGEVTPAPSSKCIPIADFNPWGISGERDLLFLLYEKLIKAIDPGDKLLTAWQSLKRRAGNLVVTSGQVAGGLATAAGQPYAGAALHGSSTLFETICTVGIAEVRKGVEEKLASFQGRLVVVLDDIDRLEREDLLTLLRILKREAALPNTTYLLAMDETHVARVVGGNEESEQIGRKYLEKILQVSLQLPEIPPLVMKGFVLGHLRSALGPENAIDHTRFDQVFDRIFLPRIRTPRTAKNLANAVRFSMGLLPGEVDPTDQVLLESSRILFPKLYQRIKDCEPHRGSSYLERVTLGLGGSDPNQEPRLWEWCKKAWIDEGAEEPNEDDKHALGCWLPQVTGLVGENGEDVGWWRSKRLCSSGYHWRYFSGAIVLGDVSDLEMEVLRQLCIEGSPQARSKLKESLLGDSGFIVCEKLCRLEYSSQDALKMVKFLSSCEFVEVSSPELAGRIFHSLENVCEVEKFLLELATEAPVRWFTKFVRHVRGKFLNSESQHNGGTPSPSLMKLAERQLADLKGGVRCEMVDAVNDIWMIWHFGSVEGLIAAIDSRLEEDPTFSLTLLASGCGIGGSVEPPRIWHWNGKESFDSISRVVDISKLEAALVRFDRSRIAKAESGDSIHRYCTREELILEFDKSLELERKIEHPAVTTD